MPDYIIHEVDGRLNADIIHELNLEAKCFPSLQLRHLEQGYWWLAYHGDEVAAFAGLVPFTPFPNTGYMKRCYVRKGHHGHNLQFRFLMARELKCHLLGWKTMVSECPGDNFYSTANFYKAGFQPCNPEQEWAGNASYLVKYL